VTCPVTINITNQKSLSFFDLYLKNFIVIPIRIKIKIKGRMRNKENPVVPSIEVPPSRRNSSNIAIIFPLFNRIKRSSMQKSIPELDNSVVNGILEAFVFDRTIAI
jgi:hypothetical protein